MDQLFAGTSLAPFVPYMYLAGGLGVLILCGNWLVTGSVQIARHFKISTLVVGLTVVAYVTSAPEMFISIGAALNNAHDIALGNVIGSNIANIGCILAIVVVISPIPIRNRKIGFDYLVMLSVTVLLLLFGFNGTIGTAEGISLVVILISYTAWSVIKSRRCASSKDIEAPTVKPLIALSMILAAVIGMYFSSGWFVEGARAIALQWGVSERVIAVSIVAVGTSSPELISSLIAAFKGENDLAIGNIIGSNFFNIAGVLGVTTIVRPLAVNSHSMFVSDMAWLFGITIALLLTMIPLSKGKINRWEGGILMLIFGAYMFILYR
ncbi:MAG: calcium/sodium antiporter [Chitinispirillia bacterium]|nr:calcium/sodium antiporter [Chitinispirillia bacterium]MCL2240928.1 calcium/sodium antiporter [Chitinispirillia bacterium]MCL2242106.1 calcium/sodium antiporter [Chitinispirillia bacterium]